MNDSNIFWLVWSENGHSTKKHKTEELARAEAERLAKKQIGDKFYVSKVDMCLEATANITSWKLLPLEEEK